MTLIFSSTAFKDHITIDHPESPMRIDAALEGSKRCLGKVDFEPLPSIRQDLPLLVHQKEQIEKAKSLAMLGGGALDEDTQVSPGSYETALLASSALCTAIDSLVSGKASRASCLVRPPGHHATAQNSMGFCLFNNVAIAAKYAQKTHGVGRILIVDWDVHHGNGTQDIFYRDDSVYFLDIHRDRFYPGTGSASETGEGPGLGSTLNIPVEKGTSRHEYLKLFEFGLEKALKYSKPDLVLISAGFDAYHLDPVGHLDLLEEDFGWMTSTLIQAAKSYGVTKILSTLEGGYHLDGLKSCVFEHINALSQD